MTKITQKSIKNLANCIRAGTGLPISRHTLLELVNVYDCKVCFRILSAEISHKYLDKPLTLNEEGGFYYYHPK